MTGYANRLRLPAVAGETILQIHFGLPGMTSAGAQVGPTGRLVTARQHHLLAMTGDAGSKLVVTS